MTKQQAHEAIALIIPAKDISPTTGTNILYTTDANAEIVPMNSQLTFEKPKKEFHLSPEQVRTNALDLAIKMWGLGAVNAENFWSEITAYEEYLWNGKRS